jgi:hypothetical protein
MEKRNDVCPDCENGFESLDRRTFFRTAGAAAGAALFAAPRLLDAAPSPNSAAETAVKGLYETLTDDQKKAVCFDWDYQDKARGLLRTHVSNNWQITKPHVRSEFYSKKQQDIIHDIFKGIINPEWYAKVLKQLKDDTGGQEWGNDQSIAIFGKPGTNKFEFVMTGRHMTIRADGDTAEHVAFGGPVFYGHAASGFNEKPGHPNNVYWHQALAANKVFQMMDPKLQAKALVEKRPGEANVGFHGPNGTYTGCPVSEISKDLQAEMQKVLMVLIEHYRKEDQDEALECVKRQGGLEKCFLTFYKEGALEEGTWDNWRLEGPSFVWYFRGTPHVHVWVNIADDPSVKLNAKG